MSEGTYRIYVTRNTEYHVLDDQCFAVLDRARGCLLDHHDARDGVVLGCARARRHGVVLLCEPQIGRRLLIRKDGHCMRTSRLVAIEQGTDLGRPAQSGLRAA